jgi:protein O-mannosyl-transferase
MVTYVNSLKHPFIFDDFGSVVRNPSITKLSDLKSVLLPPHETSVARRPVVNLSFAINYAIGGQRVFGYRVVNLAVHLACGLVLFGVVRRTLERIWTDDRRARATIVAGATALIWTVHPLNSEIVDYVSERTDGLMGLCYLGALYASIRAHESARPGRWRLASVAACAAGMGCKESMVTAPIVIWLYDVVYVYGASLRSSLRAHWRFYAALAATWIFLVPSLMVTGSISTGGFSSAHATPWTYLLNQTIIVTRYLRLALWPSSLVNFYGWTVPYTLGDVWLPAAFLTALAIAAIVTLIKAPRIGFLAVSVFILLGPTSSIIPIAAEVGAERRMYLALACIVTLIMLGLDSLCRRWRSTAFVWIAGVIAMVLAVVTMDRNREYESGLTMARTVLARWPTPMAHHLVGTELAFLGRRDEAITELSIAAPGYAVARYYLGRELGAAGRFDEAIDMLRSFIRDEPRVPVVPIAHGLIADALVWRERVSEALPHFRAWLESETSNDSGWSNYGRALFATGHAPEAAEAFKRAIQLRPRVTEYHHNLGAALAAQGKVGDAAGEFRKALEIDPNYQPAREGLAALGGGSPR